MLPSETDFYSAYDWCLDPHLTVGEAVERLAGEIDRLQTAQVGWQAGEITVNVYLLSCSLLNGIDEYLRGHTLRLPVQLRRVRPGRAAMWAAERVAETLPKQGRTRVRRWKEQWQDGMDGFFAVLARNESEPALFADAAQRLSEMLRLPLPPDLMGLRLGVPSAFSRLDLTHFDVLALGRRFMRQYPDKSHPVLLLGLRTAGTYFSALLRSSLKAEGYRRVVSLTVQPIKGPGRRERNVLTSCAKQGFTVAIVDDPPHTGGAIVHAIDIARQAGFDLPRIRVLVPTHPTAHNWADALPQGAVITLEPERWRKQQLLDPRRVENRLAEYFAQQGFSGVRVVGSGQAVALNARLQSGSSKRGATLRRIFEVQLRTPQGESETRHVLAKGVGLGYLGYPAFLAAHRLAGFIPPVLGLRDGILYTEWLPQQDTADIRLHRDMWIDTTAAYVAARTRLLRLPKHRANGKAVHENGWALLAEALGRAYGSLALNIPMRSWIQARLYRLHCPFPTLIDGNMGHAEWINSNSVPLKTGYYGHGLGKTQLNTIDPAYDLAETILSFSLSSEEEDRLIRRYVEHSGDVEVGQRLFVNKLLAGLWTMESAQEQLFGVTQSGEQQQEQHRRFLGAWDFLTVQTARFCGARYRSSQPASWRSPLVMLDVDGVIDRRIFGYPCTTAAGIGALSLLAAHGCSVALNTARSVYEVKDYCEAYGLAGGVAENGAYLWDAIAKRGRPLIDQETMIQLDELRKELRRMPGVFLDERHRYSIRAYMIEKKPRSLLLRLVHSIRAFNVGQGATIPLPTLVVAHLIAEKRLDRLSFHQTTIDTAVVAKDVDKGTGLAALRDRVLGPDAETIAVGDTEADLPMFRRATRSFAPAQISCRRQARLLGCTVSRHGYQRGLLDIARRLVGAGAAEDPIERTSESDGEALFLDLLHDADHVDARVLVRALFDRTTFRIFVR
ncbi:HAD hydrolase family protein [Bradyrhizobium sp. NP1]|uniref:HAD hydrolase family protein n=1 Tax=Bradyrhizobium sp. NP1 TaxID=3049772 RepID=UPI0025A57C6E|nr:HAD hydrolase family protein [Bradyrhizobium sp. NP1]WJR77313.1 HAD hydrolase family protein [Bradyrhizobium sp. NP1]